MTPGQTRVLVLLACLLGLQALDNPTFRTNLLKGAAGQLPPSSLAAGYIGWGAAAVALVALAAPAPKLATWLVVIFLAMNLLDHSQAWTSALASVSGGVASLTGSSAVSSGGVEGVANRHA